MKDLVTNTGAILVAFGMIQVLFWGIIVIRGIIKK